MKKLEFSRKSVDDLIRLREFITEKNPSSAGRISEILKKSILKLKKFPHLGRRLEELPECLELIIRNYTVRYRAKDDIIQIIRIWHEKEDSNSIS